MNLPERALMRYPVSRPPIVPEAPRCFFHFSFRARGKTVKSTGYSTLFRKKSVNLFFSINRILERALETYNQCDMSIPHDH